MCNFFQQRISNLRTYIVWTIESCGSTPNLWIQTFLVLLQVCKIIPKAMQSAFVEIKWKGCSKGLTEFECDAVIEC